MTGVGDADAPFAGRRVSLGLTTTPTTLEGQPNLLLDEASDVAPVAKAHDSTGSAKRISALMSLAVASPACCATQKTCVVVLVSLAFIADDDRSSRLRWSSRREGV